MNEFDVKELMKDGRMQFRWALSAPDEDGEVSEFAYGWRGTELDAIMAAHDWLLDEEYEEDAKHLLIVNSLHNLVPKESNYLLQHRSGEEWMSVAYYEKVAEAHSKEKAFLNLLPSGETRILDCRTSPPSVTF